MPFFTVLETSIYRYIIASIFVYKLIRTPLQVVEQEPGVLLVAVVDLVEDVVSLFHLLQ